MKDAIKKVDQGDIGVKTLPAFVNPALADFGLRVDSSIPISSSAGKLQACPEVYRHRGRKKVEPVGTVIARDQSRQPYFVKYLREPEEGPKSLFDTEVTFNRLLTQAKARTGNPDFNITSLLYDNGESQDGNPSVAVYPYLGDVTGFLRVAYMPIDRQSSSARNARPIVSQAVALADIGETINPAAVEPQFKIIMDKHYFARRGEELQEEAVQLVRNGKRVDVPLTQFVDVPLVTSAIDRAMGSFVEFQDLDTYTISHNDLSPQNIHIASDAVPEAKRATIIDYERARLTSPSAIAATNSIAELIPRVWQDRFLQDALISEYLAAKPDRASQVSLGINLLMQTLGKMTISFHHYAQDITGSLFDPRVELFLEQRLTNHLQLIEIGMNLIK